MALRYLNPTNTWEGGRGWLRSASRNKYKSEMMHSEIHNYLGYILDLQLVLAHASLRLYLSAYSCGVGGGKAGMG